MIKQTISKGARKGKWPNTQEDWKDISETVKACANVVNEKLCNYAIQTSMSRRSLHKLKS